MLNQEDQGQLYTKDHCTSSTNHENDSPNRPLSQHSRNLKRDRTPLNGRILLFVAMYNLTFVALIVATLITQNYFLLPVINMMAMGLVGAMYHAVGSRLPKKLVNLIDSENEGDNGA